MSVQVQHRCMAANRIDTSLLLVTWPLLTVSSIAATLILAMLAGGETGLSMDAMMAVPLVIIPFLVLQFGNVPTGAGRMERFGACLGLCVLILLAVRIMGEDFAMGLSLLSALPYSGALVAVCMTIQHSNLFAK